MDVGGDQYDFPVFTDSGRPCPHPSAPRLSQLKGDGIESMELHSGLVFWLNQPKLT